MLTDLEKLKALRQERADLQKKARTLTDDMADMLAVADGETRDLTDEETAEYEKQEAECAAIMKKIAATDVKIARREAAADRIRELTPIDAAHGDGAPAEIEDRAATKPFRNLAEQMFAIRNATRNPFAAVDPRLQLINERAQAAYSGPSGMNEGIGSEGGFALQSDFVGMILDTAMATGEILTRVDRYPIGAGYNAAKWVDIDETDVSEHVFGGIQVYFRAEADTVTKSKPKLKERELKLLMLMGVAYTTLELDEDTTFASALFERGFSTAINRKLEGQIISGKGAGTFVGILNGGDLVSVPKVAAQKADTLVVKNIISMWNRIHPAFRSNAIWLIHPDGEEQLDMLEFPVGTGGLPAYLPAGGLAGAGFSTLKGRPVVPVDHCSALGDEGDIILADLMQYMLIDKGGMRSDSSIHVRYLEGENTWRFLFRANGRPKRRSSLTIKNSTKPRASFVTLAERA